MAIISNVQSWEEFDVIRGYKKYPYINKNKDLNEIIGSITIPASSADSEITCMSNNTLTKDDVESIVSTVNDKLEQEMRDILDTQTFTRQKIKIKVKNSKLIIKRKKTK